MVTFSRILALLKVVCYNSKMTVSMGDCPILMNIIGIRQNAANIRRKLR
jgi:hypothetical protein